MNVESTSGNDSECDSHVDPLRDVPSLLDLSTDLIHTATPYGLLLHVNRSWRETLGYSDLEIRRMLMLDVVHPDHQAAVSEAVREATQGDGPRHLETVFVTRSGQLVPVKGQIDCQLDASTPVLLRAVMRDLRADKATESARETIEAQFRSAFESPAIGMAVQGLDNRWLSVNDALASMLGYTPSELIDMTFPDITHPDDIDSNVELLQTLLTGTEHRFQMEKRYIHRDGSTVSAILTVSVVRDRGGNPICFVSQVQDVTARRQLETQLVHKASHDVLTGLPNRALFMDRLDHALTRLRRDDMQIAVMFLDLDGFKAVNDQFGHEQGDRLLVEVGRRLRACARASDTVARLGGDEFTILLENVRHPSIATEVAQRVRETLSYPVMLGEHVTTISPSIGICLSIGSDDHADAMLHAADTAMYAAKRAGKDRAVVADRGDRG